MALFALSSAELVGDDERSLADTLVAMLQLSGYHSKARYSAEEAMEVLQAEQPALVISDVVMPGVNGVDLAVQARQLWPTVRILLVSGNVATQEIMDSARAAGHSFELLAKPVTPKELLTKVASILKESAMNKDE